MVLVAESDLSLVFETAVCNTQQAHYEEAGWKLADQVLF